MASAQATETSTTTILKRADLPALAKIASETSDFKQGRYVNGIRLEAIMLVIAAIAGSLSFTTELGGTTVNIFSAIAILAFGISFISHVARWIGKPNKRWFSARAIAESAKTLCWRYAVGGVPFNEDLSDEEANSEFERQFKELAAKAKNDKLPTVASADITLTPALQKLRGKSLPERRAAYRAGRIENQITWYSTKAEENRNAASFWGAVMLVLEALGAGLAGLHFFRVLPNLFGVIPAATAAVGTWLQLKQHQMLAQSYSVAAKELEMIAEKFPPLQNRPDDETAWANFVNDAEAAISREHTLWATAHANAAKIGGPQAR